MARPNKTQLAALRRVIDRLGHGVRLAEIAAEGPDPEVAAIYLADTLDGLARDLRTVHQLRDAEYRAEGRTARRAA